MFHCWYGFLYTQSAIAFFKGFLVGCFVALPVGPIGIFCLRRMLTQGALIGLASGIGGATADVVYAAVAIVGLSFVAPILHAHVLFFKIATTFFLCILGLKIFISRPPAHVSLQKHYNVLEAYISTFFLTLANPLLILSFGAFFAMFNVVYTALAIQDLVALLVGVCVGSSIWWIILSIILGSLSFHISPRVMHVINMVTGGLIILASILALLSIVFH